MSSVTERLTEAIEKDPKLGPIAEQYVKVLREVAVTREQSEHTSSRSKTGNRTKSNKTKTSAVVKADVIGNFLKQVALAQSVDEVRQIHAKYHRAMGRIER